jgi:hypothetical protein
MRSITMALVVVAAGALAGACDSEETAPSPAAGCEALARALCGTFAQCAPAAVDLTYGGEDTCLSRVTLDCTAQRDAPGSGLDEEFLSDCANAIDGCDALSGRTPEVCKTPPGDLAPGSACSFDAQCKGGRCIRDAGSDCGVCDARVPAGGSCAGDPAACEAGSVCAFAQTCVLLGDEGDPCDVDQPCGPLLACVEGTCGIGGGEGDACDDARPCDASAALWCAPSDTCEAVSFVAAGQTCGFVDGALVVCEASAQCDGEPEGTCIAVGEDGAACGGVDDDACLAPAVCASGSCVVPTGSCS